MDDSPYRPPTTRGMDGSGAVSGADASRRAATTSGVIVGGGVGMGLRSRYIGCLGVGRRWHGKADPARPGRPPRIDGWTS
jgi:hypothetical protein